MIDLTSIFTVLSVMLGVLVISFLCILWVLLGIKDKLSDIDKRQMHESLNFVNKIKPKF